MSRRQNNFLFDSFNISSLSKKKVALSTKFKGNISDGFFTLTVYYAGEKTPSNQTILKHLLYYTNISVLNYFLFGGGLIYFILVML